MTAEDNEYVLLQRSVEDLEYCGAPDCGPEHKAEHRAQHAPVECLLCGQYRPHGHVMIRNRAGYLCGRVCSLHTFLDMVRLGRDRFSVTITLESAAAESEVSGG